MSPDNNMTITLYYCHDNNIIYLLRIHICDMPRDSKNSLEKRRHRQLNRRT